MRRLLAILGLLLLSTAAFAANQWSNIVGGFPTWYGSPTFSSNAYTLASPIPSSPPYSLVTQQHLRIVIPAGGTNTGAATLNVNSTGALPIVTNIASGLTALIGGELVAGLEYDLTYSASSASACASSCYVMSWLAGSPVLAGTSQTVTAAQWAVLATFEVATSGQTLTLPQASTVSPNGGVVVMTGANNVTIAPHTGDAITYGSVAYAASTSVLLPAGTFALITRPSAGNITISATTTFAVAIPSMISASAFGAL